MALPMGTIMAGTMLIGVLFASRLPVLSKTPALLQKLIGVLVLLGGLWNFLWYSLRHLTEFWGIAALVSGLLMIIVGCYLIKESILPQWLIKLRPIVLVVLLGYGMMYAITIYRL